MKVLKNLKYQTQKMNSETLLKNPNVRTGAIKGGTLRIFKYPLLQNIRKFKGTLWGILPLRGKEKVAQCRKKLKRGTLWSRPVWYVMRKNRKNLFSSVR